MLFLGSTYMSAILKTCVCQKEYKVAEIDANLLCDLWNNELECLIFLTQQQVALKMSFFGHKTKSV